MNTSKLIKELQTSLKKHGDLPVLVFLPRRHNKVNELNFVCPMNCKDEPPSMLLLAHTEHL